MTAPRSASQRRSDALEKLNAVHADAWVATASGQGAHLVPLSFAWNGEQVLLATEERSASVQNLRSVGSARIALGATRDVVLIEAVLDRIVAVAEAPDVIAEIYAGQADWDPRDAGGDFVFVVLRPVRVQVWREANEIAGRTVMRDGSWVD
jgi:hypothetical protein